MKKKNNEGIPSFKDDFKKLNPKQNVDDHYATTLSGHKKVFGNCWVQFFFFFLPKNLSINIKIL